MDTRIDGNSSRRIIYDGLNLALGQGTGIATYTRMLTRVAHGLGYDVGVVYGMPFEPSNDPVLQDVLFFDQLRPQPARRRLPLLRTFDAVIDQLRCQFAFRPPSVPLGEAVIADQFADKLPTLDRAFFVRNLFDRAFASFKLTGQSVRLSFDPQPNIFHCTYPVPVQAVSACNIYTIHDLVPLRLPFTTLDNKRHAYRLLKSVASKADHIVTVSEASKRDIVAMLGIEEGRVTNTYQTVVIPQPYLDRTDAAVANYLDGMHGLEMRGYLLFFGALEPKKNVGRLIDAYLGSGINIPLVLITGRGWQNAAELQRINELTARGREQSADGPTIRCLDYVDLSTLVSFIRGARAVVFPSLYEGFGLPVLEAMMLGTPVIASAAGGLGEIVGEAALVVDPYDVEDIARGLRTIVNDADLRSELTRRGTLQAALFSLARYQERVQSLYSSLA